VRHQTLVAVGAGIGEGIDGVGVLDDAADVVERHFRQPAVLVAGEQVLAALGERLMHVHAAAVVAHQRLGHEGRRLAVAVGDVLDDVLQTWTSSAFFTSVLNLTPISHWPAVATSWWWTSTGTPISSSVRHMAPRMSCSASTGGTGK